MTAGDQVDTIKPATLQVGDIAFIVDGGRVGNHSQLLKPWVVGTSKDSKALKQSLKDDDVETSDAGSSDSGSKIFDIFVILNSIFKLITPIWQVRYSIGSANILRSMDQPAGIKKRSAFFEVVP